MKYVSCLLSVALLACSSTKEDTNEVVSSDESASDDTILSSGIIDQNKGLGAGPTAVSNWQIFFKPPPTAVEKSKLEQKLVEWDRISTASSLLAKSRAEIALGRYRAAEATLMQIVRQDSQQFEALLELANLQLRTGATAKAFEYILDISDLLKSDIEFPAEFRLKFRYTQGLALIARGDRQLGHKVLSELIGTDQTFAPAYATLASSYLDIDNINLAEFVVKRALDRITNQPSLYNLAGIIAMRSGNIEQSREWFDKAIAIDGKFSPALINRAILSLNAFEFGSAEEDVLHALKLDPLNAEALTTYGIVQRRQGNYTGARAAFVQAIDANPLSPYPRFNLAVLFIDNLKNPDEAIRLLNEVVQIKNSPRKIIEQAQKYLSEIRIIGEKL